MLHPPRDRPTRSAGFHHYSDGDRQRTHIQVKHVAIIYNPKSGLSRLYVDQSDAQAGLDTTQIMLEAVVEKELKVIRTVTSVDLTWL